MRAPPPRLRDLGIAIGTLPPGERNALTDVPGVRVGNMTIVKGEPGRDEVIARTGVTAIHPHEGSAFQQLVPAAIEVLNGSGEITGRSQIDEYGLLETPILITSTHSVGAAHRACVEWLVAEEPTLGRGHFVVPVVAETYDGYLSDTRIQHVFSGHVYMALDTARNGPVEEGSVGGGTGMLLFGFKGGIGTSSRMVEIGDRRYAVGVLVQGNTGARDDLLVDGVPVGLEIRDLLPEPGAPHDLGPGDGSIIVVIATDAPLTDRQLRRLCKRGILGLGRVGAVAQHSSGDLLLAFSNALEARVERTDERTLIATPRIADKHMNGLFRATIEATSEAVLNAMVAAETTVGRSGNVCHALPHERLQEVMRRYGRLRL
jgi:D-aminopeptidase